MLAATRPRVNNQFQIIVCLLKCGSKTFGRITGGVRRPALPKARQDPSPVGQSVDAYERQPGLIRIN